MAVIDYAFLPMGLILARIAYFSAGLFNVMRCFAELMLRISWQGASHWMLWAHPLCGLMQGYV